MPDLNNTLEFNSADAPLTVTPRNQVELLVEEGVALRKAGKHSEAVSVYKEASQIEGAQPFVFFNLGNAPVSYTHLTLPTTSRV